MNSKQFVITVKALSGHEAAPGWGRTGEPSFTFLGFLGEGRNYFICNLSICKY